MIKYLFIIGSIICSVALSGQNAHQLLRQGDEAYEDLDYLQAEEYYRKSEEKEAGLKSTYNLGNSIYEQQRFEEAVEHYEKALNRAVKPEEKKNAHYNLGNAYFQKGDFEKSINSYKEVLKMDQGDIDAKGNLFLAQQMLRQMQQQQQQQQNQEEQQEEQEEQEEQQQQDQQQENEENENQEDSQQQQQQQQEKQEQEAEQSEPGEEEKDLSLEDALKLLEVIENEEKKVQEKLRKVSASKNTSKKDW